jgi:hypothetical protein
MDKFIVLNPENNPKTLPSPGGREGVKKLRNC